MLRFVAILLSGWSLHCAADFNVGLIDLQKAIMQTTDGQRAKRDLESEFKKRQQALQNMEARMKKMSEEFERKAIALSKDARARQQLELQSEMRKFQEAIAKNQKEMEARQRDLFDPIVTKINSIAMEIAQKEGFKIVMNRPEGLVLFAAKEIDLTDRVVGMYNNRHRS